MNKSTNTVVMTDSNRAAKEMRLQLVLGSTIVIGSKTVFDVGLLQLAGSIFFKEDKLYRVLAILERNNNK